MTLIKIRDPIKNSIKFLLMNGREITLTKEELSKIITTELSNNIYWLYNKKLSHDEVRKFFRAMVHDSDIEPEILDKIASYILFFVENTTLTVYLYKNKDKQYLEEQLQILKELREKYKTVIKTKSLQEKKEIIDDMLEICLGRGIDPF